MRIYSGYSVDELYAQVVPDLIHAPEYITRSRDREIREIHNCALVLKDARYGLLTNPGRKLSNRYAAGELAFYLAGADSLDFIAHYAKFWRGISDDGKRVNSCYGKRLFKETSKGETQIGYVVKQLLARKETRKAVAIIYKERDTNPETLDNPCTMYLHFAIRNDKLLLTTQMRSNDVWLGTPYDMFFFSTLQRIVLAQIQNAYPEVTMGEYAHFANSLHLYGKDAAKAQKLEPLGSYDVRRLPAFGPEDMESMRPFLMREELMRNAPNAIPGWDGELEKSSFFALMTRFLEGRDA